MKCEYQWKFKVEACPLQRISVFYEYKSYFRSAEWQKISKDEREKIGLTFEEDGECW